MSEFFFPEYGDWLPIADRLSREVAKPQNWDQRALGYIVSQPNYITAKGIITGPLSLPARRDYYQEERAALVVAGFYRASPPTFGGGVAFLLGMAQFQQHILTRRMGLELLIMLSAFQDQHYKRFELDEPVAQWAAHRIEELPNRNEDETAVKSLVEDCSSVIENWIKDPSKPLSSLLSTRQGMGSG